MENNEMNFDTVKWQRYAWKPTKSKLLELFINKTSHAPFSTT